MATHADTPPLRISQSNPASAGSNPRITSPPRAIAGELGRIRAELGAAADPDADREMAGKVDEWFRARLR